MILPTHHNILKRFGVLVIKFRKKGTDNEEKFKISNTYSIFNLSGTLGLDHTVQIAILNQRFGQDKKCELHAILL